MAEHNLGNISDAAVAAIQQSVQTTEISIDGAPFTTRLVFLPPAEPLPKPILVHTLSSLCDFVKVSRDAAIEVEAVHVEGPERVTVLGPIAGRHSQRAVLAIAEVDRQGFQFGHFYDPETFVIALQALFTEAGDRANVLKVVGNMRGESSTTVSDDGRSQSVKIGAGVVLVSDVQVPNPVGLAPYRTFAEVHQTASPFILRVKTPKEGALPHCALFEADGGHWRLGAISEIRDWLRDRLNEAKLEDVPIWA